MWFYGAAHGAYPFVMPPARAVLGGLLAAMLSLPAAAQIAPGLHSNVIFSGYGAYSQSNEIVRRAVTPLAAGEIGYSLAQTDKRLEGQSVDLKNERFTVYVPAQPPPSAGYGLLVFIAPWDEAVLPEGWSAVLDTRGIVFVTAALSGNDQNVFNRRVPLALLGEENIVRRLHIDRSRIYVAGFSGGSRVAMRVALDYPDIFDGAFLDAGGDPIGTSTTPLPPADLFRRFQEASRLYYAAGVQDYGSVWKEKRSIRSMREQCVFHFTTEWMPHTVHEIADPQVLSNALDFLEKPPAPGGEDLASCRKGVETDLQAALANVRAAIVQGKPDEARKRLLDVNDRFGGLAAKDLLTLARQLNLFATLQQKKS